MMNQFKTVLALSLFLITPLGFSQEMTEEQKKKAENKVTIFTSEERDNIQLVYVTEVEKMNLSEADEDEYMNIFYDYIGTINRYDDHDHDKDYTEEEITEKINKDTKAMNVKIKTLLTPENYDKHLEIFQRILYSISERSGYDISE
ncbi:hypothetical protein F6U93_14515 [Tamlana haliotis]|uniref:Uncharacterized protein n=1 Tax=Pseudotamlana haliotis TaxID=2614804 RepID=A0A6N6M5J5_9FLAO|nr:hypothetical protein [Tamlana haliotis]KAB1063600.1 hypothetical protein F6U93_14515 [Tamlana haliotis]